MTPLLGFSPDVEPTTAGAMLECDGLIPYEAGMKAAPSAVGVGMTALSEPAQGSAVVRQLTGTSRLLVGTATKLWEVVSGSWVQQGTGYLLSADNRWSFASFGDSVLATSPATTIVRSTGGAFNMIDGAPRALCLVASKGFVLAFNTSEATYGASPDRWMCSALFNDLDWTPNLATQANTGRLIGGSGPINAAARFGDDVVAYKSRAMFLGTYVGGDVTWAWNQVGFDVGCVGVEAVVDTSIGHIFVGSDDIYKFDGTRPVSIAGGRVRQWWLANSSAQYRYRTKLQWDRDAQLVRVFFPSVASSGECDDCLVLHVGTGQWGRVRQGCEAVTSYVSAPWTYDGGAQGVTDYNSLPNVPYDSPFWMPSKSSPAVVDLAHSLKVLTGAAGSWSFSTGDYGDEAVSSFCSAVRMRFAKLPASVSCEPVAKATSGDVGVVGAASVFDGSKFPLRQTARFHGFRVFGSGEAKFSGIDPSLSEAGVR